MAKVSTIKVLDTGIFELPDGVTADQIKAVYLNGAELETDQFAINENGSIDVFEVTDDSIVTADLAG